MVEKIPFITSLLPSDIRLEQIWETFTGKPFLLLARKTERGDILHGAECESSITDEALKGLVEDIVFHLQHRELDTEGNIQRTGPQMDPEVFLKEYGADPV